METTAIFSLVNLGKIAKGDVVTTTAAAPAHAHLDLPWHDLPDNELTAAEPRVFDWLNWKGRLAPTMIGAAPRLQPLLAWAEEQSSVAIRQVVGEGGLGKTRLAAELCAALREQGWEAGFLGPRGPVTVAPGNKPALIVLDYPEEDPDRVCAVLTALHDAPPNRPKLRIVLLSRPGEPVWDDVLRDLRLPWRLDISLRPPTFSPEEAAALADGIRDRLAKLRRCTPAPLPVEALNAWMAQSALHRHPLLISALAVQSVLEPARSATSLDGRQVIAALADRELTRLRNESRRQLGDAELFPALAALAVAGKGLDAPTLRALTERPPPGFPTGGQSLWQALTRVGGVEGLVLPAPRPDLVAAALAAKVLAKAADRAGEWLWWLVERNPTGVLPGIERLIHDAETVLGERTLRLATTLAGAVQGNEERCRRVAGAYTRDTYLLAPFWVGVFSTLTGLEPDPAARAGYFNNLSIALRAAGQREEASTASEKAVALYRQLAKAAPGAFRPNLAASLTNQSNRLAEAGRPAVALEAIEEAVALYRQLAEAAPEAFLPDLAGSLHTWSVHLAMTGEPEEALKAIKEAVALYHPLVEAEPNVFLPAFASIINDLSNLLAVIGKRLEALAAIEEAVALYRQLAEAAPETFRPNLASSLNNLSNRLAAVRRRPEALAASEEAVALYRQLAEAAPEAFLPDLARSLGTKGAVHRVAGELAAARAAWGEGLRLLAPLAAREPAGWVTNLKAALERDLAKLD